jgi:hypothetical protein
VRAAYAALLFGLLGGLGLATVVLSSRSAAPVTIAAVLGTKVPPPELARRRAEAVAVLTAECMARRGVRWLPVPEAPPSIPDADLGPVDWARRWGFGVSTAIGRAEPAASADSNLAALERATPEQRDAALRALHGDGAEPGCQVTANGAVYGLRDRLLAPLKGPLDALGARIDADPAAARALRAWRSCVAPVAAGLPLDRRSLPGALLERFARSAGALAPNPGWVAGLAALQADERRVATVVARCEEAYTIDRAGVIARHEAEFVGEHLATLDRVGSAIRAAEAALPTLPP